ncbi:MAG: hypothetical protein H6837_21195 [Planctomycetes bacterium]|nr:hypothetical protein [Planctomycetota bacterium]
MLSPFRRAVHATVLFATCTVVAAPVSPPTIPAQWPPITKSFLVGDRARPADGELLIGVLAKSGTGRPLAELVAPERLKQFLARGQVAAVGPEPQEVESIIEEWVERRLVDPTPIGRVICRATEVLADDCAELPLVVCPGGPRNAYEFRLLHAYLRGGGIILLERSSPKLLRAVFGSAAVRPASSLGMSADVAGDLEVLVLDGRVVGFATARRDLFLTHGDTSAERAREARAHAAIREALFRFLIRSSAKLRLLDGEPFAVRSARRDADDLVVQLTTPRHPGAKRATVHAALVDLEGKVLWRRNVRSETGLATVRGPCREADVDPIGTRLQLLWYSRGVEIRRAPTVEELVGATNVTLLGSTRAYVGSAWSVRVLVTDTKRKTAIPGRELRVAIERGGTDLASTAARTDALGTLDARLHLGNEIAAGPATLRVGLASVPIQLQRHDRMHAVSDRTLYRPTDTVHVRLLLRHYPSGRPTRGDAVAVELRDPKRAVVARRTLTSSEHGIAATAFALERAAAGNYTITAKASHAATTARFRVQAFELPRFLLGCSPDQLVGRPGERVPVALQVRYVDGAPVKGARVRVTGGGQRTEGQSGSTDEAGRFRTVCTLAADDAERSVRFVVTDQDGCSETLELPCRCLTAEHRVSLALLDVPILGRPLRVGVTARRTRDGRPASGKITLRATGVARECSLDLDGRGTATFPFTPTSAQTRVDATVTGGSGVSNASLDITCRVVGNGAPVVVPDALVTRAGRTLGIDVLGTEGPVLLDVYRDGMPLRMLSGRIAASGSARLSLAVDETLAGFLTLRAYRLDGIERISGTAQNVLVLRDRELKVTARPERQSYRPGEIARVAVSVRDAAGAPTAGVLGYWAVDRGLLAQSPWERSSEPVFDLTPERARPHHLELLHSGLAATAGDALAVFGVAPTLAGAAQEFSLRFDWLANRRRWATQRARGLAAARIVALRQAVIRALSAVPLREFPLTQSLHHTVRWLLERQRLQVSDLMGPWGRPLEVWSRNRAWRCAGPDGVVDTPDDEWGDWMGKPVLEGLPERTKKFLRFVRRERAARKALGRDEAEVLVAEEVDEEEVVESAFDSNQWNVTVGLGSGSGGRTGGRRTTRRNRASAPPRLRKDFPPTLTFVPERVIGPTGEALLEIPLADSTTTWQLRAVASTLGGHTGVGETSLLVTQPFQVEPWITPQLTAGDRIEVPALVRNGANAAVRAELEVVVRGAALAVVGPAARILEVGPTSAAAHRFGLRATHPGTAVVRVTGSTGTTADAVERQVVVRPYGRARHTTRQATVTATAPWRTEWNVPRDGVAPASLELTILPDALATVLSGFAGLVREPHGCFEQTSSTLYPMVLALDILGRREARGEDGAAALAAQARERVAHGYRRLLQFEVGDRSGGFELFGRAPANTMLTAYGLLEFHDIARVHPIDPSLIPRIRNFLLARQRADGSFEPSAFGTLRNAKSDAFRTTAYVAWALAATGTPSPRATAWLVERAREVQDDYGRSLAALALLHGTATAPLGRWLMDRVQAGARRDADGRSCAPLGETWLGARGSGARIETTALAANALLAAGLDAKSELDWLAAQRSPDGRFGSTFSTVLALSAFARAEARDPIHANSNVEVVLDGKSVARRKLTAGSSDSLRVLLAAALPPGPHTVAVRVDGKRTPRACLTLTDWSSWTAPAALANANRRLDLRVVWPAAPVAVGKPARCTFTLRNEAAHDAVNVVAEIGLPPGCTVDERSLQGPKPARVERDEGRLVLYVDRVRAGESLRYEFGFTPRFRLNVRTGPSRAYEYYVPEDGVEVAPARVRTD